MCKAKFPYGSSTYMSYDMRDAIIKRAKKDGTSRAEFIRKSVTHCLRLAELKELVGPVIAEIGRREEE